jgi:phosphatidate cytidylyltransferase
MTFAIKEASRMAKLPRLYKYLLFALALATIYLAYSKPNFFYGLPLLYFLILSIVAIKQNDKKGLFHLTLAVFISIWILFSLAHIILLSHLNSQFDNTKSLLFLVGFSVAFSDVGAYVVGRAFLKSPLNKFKIAENISHNKTYAGILGNILGAGIGIWIMYFAIKSYFLPYQLVSLAVIVGILSSLGGFINSLYKRYFREKHSGALIPGHGGVLDRVDSIIFTLIATYYYLLLILS